MNTDPDKINELLSRSVATIYPNKEALENVLKSGKKLRIYQGFDPTGEKLHIGHMVGLRKHRQWQDMGHEVIFLIGDGTGQAGDPSGKKKTREKFYSQEELRENAKGYLEQASKIVRFDGDNPIKILYNGDWLNKLNLVDILNIAEHFTVQQMIERDMFQERIKEGNSINLREFLYPLLQAYDSVAMDVDLELGGTDQTFNMLAGRALIKEMKNKEKFVMTTPLLADSLGVKIGKSEGNVIALTDSPPDLFGKIMALGDDSIIPMFTLLTDVSLEEINSFDIKKDAMNLKKRAAFLVVEQLHNKSKAEEAVESFEKTFSRGEFPEDAPVIEIEKDKKLTEAMVASGAAASMTAARRLIEDGAVSYSKGEKIEDPNILVSDLKEGRLKIGKKNFINIASK